MKKIETLICMFFLAAAVHPAVRRDIEDTLMLSMTGNSILVENEIRVKKDVVWNREASIRVLMPADCRPVLPTALEIFAADMEKVLGAEVCRVEDAYGANIMISINPEEVKSPQGFRIVVTDGGKVKIAGHDSHGAAYGLLELSRLAGVSPWEWWADAEPDILEKVVIPSDYIADSAPDVEFRGIFINDEDWGLMPWSCSNFEPAERGVIGPKTTSKIFELLLRLRANTYWPPMHECSHPFFLTPGNREVADKYGIYIGGSHCEPMASSTAGEWPRRGIGEYDYVSNSVNVKKFWETRLNDVDGQEIIYTLGMRGVHDGAMNGVKGIHRQKEVLTDVISDQLRMLEVHNLSDAPKVFIPYKEVLDVYNAGMDVPEDVTLIWCDDNYGYISHFPDEKERDRKGGNGVYYHVSYWGRPHDYLWLGTFSPGLLFQQMGKAYTCGIDRMWILNVGDIKPAEYQIELFMDMAWDFEEVRRMGVEQHAANFLTREFGKSIVSALLPVMKEHYRLAHIRRPEFMGNTRTEEYGTDYYNHVRDLPWGEKEIRDRLESYAVLSDSVCKYAASVPLRQRDKYFQLIQYPVQSADQMNRKLLYGQLARHGKADWELSNAAYDSIQALTERYNTPKWKGIMDCNPRRLPVFRKLEMTTADTPLPDDEEILKTFDGIEGTGFAEAYEWLGYGNGAVGINSGGKVSFLFDSTVSRDLKLRVCMLPTHSLDEKPLSFNVVVDGKDYGRFEYSTFGRSEEWKENKLTNRSVRELMVSLEDTAAHKIDIISNSDGVVLDQLQLLK